MRRIVLLAVAVLAWSCGATDVPVETSTPTAASTRSVAPSATETPTPAPPTATPTPEGTPPPTTSPTGVTVGVAVATGEPGATTGAATVAAHVDGDTFDVTLGGVQHRVRLLLVDTPEVFGGTDCYGPEASAVTRMLVPLGTQVRLEEDVSETDQYDRLLRYVYLPDGRMLNEVLVAEGYARLATYPPDVREVERIRAAETAARTGGRGLWSACVATATPAAATPTPAPIATSTLAPTATPKPTATAQACDASYPDVCIPPYPPDLDCGQIPFRRFRVVGPDPHRFDGDHDGIGCES